MAYEIMFRCNGKRLVRPAADVEHRDRQIDFLSNTEGVTEIVWAEVAPPEPEA